MAFYQKTRNSKLHQGCGGKGTLCPVGETENRCSHYGNSMEVSLKKIELKLSCGSAIPLLDIYPKEMKTLTQNVLHPHVH